MHELDGHRFCRYHELGQVSTVTFRGTYFRTLLCGLDIMRDSYMSASWLLPAVGHHTFEFATHLLARPLVQAETFDVAVSRLVAVSLVRR